MNDGVELNRFAQARKESMVRKSSYEFPEISVSPEEARQSQDFDLARNKYGRKHKPQRSSKIDRWTRCIFVPGSILTLGAGYVFSRSLGLIAGVLVASLAVQAGATIGALISFLIARHLLFETVQSWILKYPKMKAVEKALTYNGLTVLCLLRLSPIIPWGPLNYMMGVTGMPFNLYALSCIAMIPDTVAWVYIGASLGSFTPTAQVKTDQNTNEGDTGMKHEWIVSVIGLLATIIAVYVLTSYSNRMLKKTIKNEGEEEANDQTEMLRLKHDSDSHMEP
eukprot:CAMPEP_0117852704 /NCGR_PEP_ID=MMETSP0949-20121206/23237_1 /TAXON_ID=44440 /ORGANISM="Chattonella subsalsa, Strain CCMP2191" /LENGTH=279 /DNA_ID=CAMNT_0005700931 /DNA_START=148 /DNA_END=987 /DNA_ORIENTATION=+